MKGVSKKRYQKLQIVDKIIIALAFSKLSCTKVLLAVQELHQRGTCGAAEAASKLLLHWCFEQELTK